MKTLRNILFILSLIAVIVAAVFWMKTNNYPNQELGAFVSFVMYVGAMIATGVAVSTFLAGIVITLLEKNKSGSSTDIQGGSALIGICQRGGKWLFWIGVIVAIDLFSQSIFHLVHLNYFSSFLDNSIPLLIFAIISALAEASIIGAPIMIIGLLMAWYGGKSR